MNKLDRIGLDKNKVKKLAELLHELLANYSVFYPNTRGYHWNIKGDKFFVLHLKFEELYNDLILKIDEIAERILTLSHTPDHKFTAYLAVSDIPESKEVRDGYVSVKEIIEAFKVLLTKQREIMHLSAEIDDEGTHALMNDYIREQEKLVWMYSAFLSK